MFSGLFHLSAVGCLLVLLLITHITIVSVSIYLHRHQAHHALELHPVASHFFRFWLWLTYGVITREWVAVHRKHHAFTDKQEDPHSPKFHGLNTVLFKPINLYQQEVHNQEVSSKFATYTYGTPQDWIEENIYTRFKYLGLYLLGLTCFLLFGLSGLCIFVIQRVWMPFWASGVGAGFGHYLGYRNFEKSDSSTNIFPIGLLLAGEELHNNHHTYAASAKLSVKWWEFDLGWLYIKILSYLKLARINRAMPTLMLLKDPVKIDINLVKAIINNRFQIISYYYKEVILPVLQIEKANLSQNRRKSFMKARLLLKREFSSLNEKQVKSLNSLLSSYKLLATVYQFQHDLQNVWLQKASSQVELIKSLENWCFLSESSTISQLCSFSQKLKRFTSIY